MSKPFSTLALLSLLICRAASGADWPQYRGPDRDGVWKETGILEKFPADGLKFRWRVVVAWGFSSPVISGGRVYVTDVVFLPKPRADERVHCFDETTGKSLSPGWQETCMGAPVLANHHVFARNDKELVCASLEARP